MTAEQILKNYEDLAALVRTMRTAQQNFFETRKMNYLFQARKLEAEVDEALKRDPNAPFITQAKLFNA